MIHFTPQVSLFNKTEQKGWKKWGQSCSLFVFNQKDWKLLGKKDALARN